MTLDARYKTRIPWRQVLNIPTNEGIPHNHQASTQEITKRRKKKADLQAQKLRDDIKKIHHNPWKKSDERFFNNKIFLKVINNHVVENLPIPSSFDPLKSQSLSSIHACNRNYLNDVTDPRFTKGTLEPRTRATLGPGAYLRGGSRSVLRLQPLRKKLTRASSFFQSVERPDNIFEHLNTYEREREEEKKREEEKWKQEKKKRKEEGRGGEGGREEHGEKGEGGQHARKKPRRERKPVEEEKPKKMVTSSMPLRRAREYYEKYGKEMVGGIMGDFFYFFFSLILFDTLSFSSSFNYH